MLNSLGMGHPLILAMDSELAGWFNQFAENPRGQLEKVAQNTSTLSTSAKELLSTKLAMVAVELNSVARKFKLA